MTQIIAKHLLTAALLAVTTAASAAPEWVLPEVRVPRVQRHLFQSRAAGAEVSYFTYTPAAYDSETERRFPVLYWLHGSGGGVSGVPQVARHFDTAIRAGKIPPMIVVFPNGLPNGMWCDSIDGTTPMETIVIKELLPRIDATLRSIAAREGRMIEGFSMGGYGAARLGLKHPALFAAVSMLGAGPLQLDFSITPRASAAGRDRILNAVYGGDYEHFKALSPWRIAEQNAAALREGMLIRQVVGDRDETLPANRDFHAHLEQLNIPHNYTELPGIPHNPMAVLNTLGEGNWEFYRKAFAGETGSTLSVVAVLHVETALARTHDIEIRDGIAYLAGKGGSLAVVDVKQPAMPKLLWCVRDPVAYADAETVLPLGKDRLLVGTRDLLLFDVANPAQPKLLASIKDRPRVDTINGFAKLGDVVFGANKFGHVVAVDVSTSDTIKLLGARETSERGELSSPHDAAFCGDLLVVVSPEGFGRDSKPGRIVVYRVIDPKTRKVLPAEQWALVSKLEHPRLAGANRVMTRGSFAYVGSSLGKNSGRSDELRSNVSIIDLTDPAQPQLRGSIDYPDARGPNGLEIDGTNVFAAGGQTVQVVDVTSPDLPREVCRLTAPGAFPGAADDGHDLVLVNGHLFVTAQSSHSLVVLRFTPSAKR